MSTGLCFLGTGLCQGQTFDFFEARIRPVLVERCYKCHSAAAEKLRGGLRLDSRDAMLKGGESGRPAVVPGRPEESLLIQAVRYADDDLQMPPAKEGGRLETTQIEDFVRWIQEGALDPRTNEVVHSPPASSRDHWAFQPVTDPTVPAVGNRAWIQNDIDAFVLARLEAARLEPSPPADKRALIRRATHDLTGLPPTWEQVESFLADTSHLAFEKVLDRLLASPHYGERWGRHWLDVARYSDTKGYVYDREEKRFVHSHVYRDWVVRAFNEDMPYDRFLKLQLAADQLGSDSNQWDLAALGFLTVGRRFLGVVHDIIDDRIDVLMRGTQGLTVSCARCHDHKFDPIPITDYYSLYGVFHSTSEKTVPAGPPRDTGDIYQAYLKGLREREDKLHKSFQEKRAKKTDRLRAQVADYLLAVLEVKKLPSEEFYTIMGPDDLNPVIVRQWEAYIHRCAAEYHRVFGPWNEFARARDFGAVSPEILRKLEAAPERVNPLVREAMTKAPLTGMRDVAERYGRLFSAVDKLWRSAATNAGAALSPAQEEIHHILYGADSPATVPDGAIIDIEWFFEEDARVELAKLQAEIDRWLLKAPAAPPHAVILADRPTPKNARVFLRGNPANKGEEVPRRYLEVLGGRQRGPFRQGSGRLELAEAIAHPDNPLTARVMVNRVWQHHFGAGLVRTASDFGTRCEPPSHPELLDWLARRFMEDGWSLKKLHKRVMLAAAYQQRSDTTPTTRAAEIDPENRLLWRMNRQRLTFEAARDSLLAVSGELDLSLGGKAAEMFSNAGNKRRTLYGYIDRQFLPAVLRVFDFANPDLHIPQRPETTVPQQALYFMNSPFISGRARALANQLAHDNIEQRVDQLYRRVYQRAPTPRQLELALEFLRAAEVARPEILTRPKPKGSPWRYGFGALDEGSQRLKSFQALPHFTGEAWQGGPNWPDGKLGWLQLTAEGGHPGNDLSHAVVRRWVAPSNITVAVAGTVRHEPKEGDGIVARVISSRTGVLGRWHVHAGNADAKLDNVELQEGDTLDFVVDIGGGLNSDQFKWTPVLKLAGAGPEVEWNARKDFGGPPSEPSEPLSPWEKYVQVVLQSNEFMFVD